MSNPAIPPSLHQRPQAAPAAFHFLAKPTGAICNLDCAYYFFLDKEVFNPGSKFRMSAPVLEQYSRQLPEGSAPKTHQAWQLNLVIRSRTSDQQPF